jgi:hypothetical protein
MLVCAGFGWVSPARFGFGIGVEEDYQWETPDT